MGRNSKKYGMRIIIKLMVAFVILPSFLFGQENQVRIALCYDSTLYLNIEYRLAITKSIDRVLTSLNSNLKPEVRFRSCVNIPNFSFYGNEEAIFGREEAFAAMVESAYWIAAMDAIHYSEGEEVFQNCSQLDWIDAFRLAKARLYFKYDDLEKLLAKVQQYTGMNNAEITKYKNLVETLHLEENGFAENTPSDHTFKLASEMYRAIIDNATAFVIGHELFHYMGNKDIVKTKSNIEVKGVFNKLYALQHSGRLFDPSIQSDKSEIRADISGFRILEIVNKKQHFTNKNIETLTRKASINLIAFPLLLGFDLADLDLKISLEYQLIKSYLYPQIRLLLYSATLQSNEENYSWAVSICGNTAKAIVTIIQKDVAKYDNSDGEIPDEVLHLLPKGVAIGWETNYWDENSFNCVQK